MEPNLPSKLLGHHHNLASVPGQSWAVCLHKLVFVVWLRWPDSLYDPRLDPDQPHLLHLALPVIEDTGGHAHLLVCAPATH